MPRRRFASRGPGSSWDSSVETCRVDRVSSVSFWVQVFLFFTKPLFLGIGASQLYQWTLGSRAAARAHARLRPWAFAQGGGQGFQARASSNRSAQGSLAVHGSACLRPLIGDPYVTMGSCPSSLSTATNSSLACESELPKLITSW